MLIGVLRTGKENPEIMARGYIIDAASLGREVDITVLPTDKKTVGTYIVSVMHGDGTVSTLDFWEKYKSNVDDISAK